MEKNGMKKGYETPKAEKIVFDYTESVIACKSDNNPQNGCDYFPNQQQRNVNQQQRNVTVDVSDANRDLGNSYHKCACSNYWGD